MRVLVSALAFLAAAEAFAPSTNPAFIRQGSTSTELQGVKNPPPNESTPLKALGFLGAAGALLGVTVFGPISDIGSPGAMSTGPPSVVKETPSKAAKTAAPKPAAAKKEVLAPKPAAKKITKTVREQGYDFEGLSKEEKIESEKAIVGEKLADIQSKKEAEAKAKSEMLVARKAAEDKAVVEKKAEAAKVAAEKAAAKEEKAKAAAEKAEEKAKAAAEKADSKKKGAAEKKAEVAADAARTEEEKAAELEADKKVAEEKAEKAKAEEAAAKVKAEAKAATEKKAAEAEKKAIADEKAAEEKLAKDTAAAPAPKPVPAPAPAPKPVPAPVPVPAPASSPSAGFGVVSGSASGGRVLPKEEVSADTLSFLKKYN